jgi:hypothetical protein
VLWRRISLVYLFSHEQQVQPDGRKNDVVVHSRYRRYEIQIVVRPSNNSCSVCVRIYIYINRYYFIKSLQTYASFHDLHVIKSDNAIRIVHGRRMWHGYVSLVHQWP